MIEFRSDNVTTVDTSNSRNVAWGQFGLEAVAAGGDGGGTATVTGPASLSGLPHSP